MLVENAYQVTSCFRLIIEIPQRHDSELPDFAILNFAEPK